MTRTRRLSPAAAAVLGLALAATGCGAKEQVTTTGTATGHSSRLTASCTEPPPPVTVGTAASPTSLTPSTTTKPSLGLYADEVNALGFGRCYHHYYAETRLDPGKGITVYFARSSPRGVVTKFLHQTTHQGASSVPGAGHYHLTLRLVPRSISTLNQLGLQVASRYHLLGHDGFVIASSAPDPPTGLVNVALEREPRSIRTLTQASRAVSKITGAPVRVTALHAPRPRLA